MRDWSRIRYFKLAEFSSPDEPGSGAKMDSAFMERLDLLRADIGRPLVVTSGYRTVAHNREVGGKRNSEHRKGLGADLQCASSRKRFLIIEAACRLDFRRIGIAKNYIHLGMSRTLPQGVIWTYR